MCSQNLALTLLLISACSSLPAQTAGAPQENKTEQQKTWTNADLEQLLSQEFISKVPGEKIWSNADLNRLRDVGIMPKAPEEKVWTNARLEQRLSQPAVSKKPGEKVWTNGDLDELRDAGPISIIGPIEEEDLERGAASRPYDETKDPEWYAAQAAELRAKLNYKRAELQRFLQGLQSARDNGYMTNGVTLTEPGIGLTPDSAIQFLERSIRDIQRQLDGLEDLAHRNGIEPGVMRVSPPVQ